MSKKKACKNCKIFFDTDSCPQCGGKETASTWKGRLFILDVKKSKVAEKIKIEKEGEYAIKVS